MSRRRFIAIISLCTLAVLGLIGVTIGLVATRSDRGQAELRRWVEARVGGAMKGRMHIGRVSGTWLTGVTIDSLEMRDDEDSLFVATGRIRVEYDPRDLVDRRLHFRRLDLEHPVIVLRQHENWSWNFKRMFAYGGPKQGNTTGRGFGDFIVIDSLHVRGADFRVTVPWHPDDSLRGARRDSAIRVNLARKDHEVRRTAEGYTQNYRWTNGYAAVPYARINDPDSIGKFFVIDTLHAAETMPPFVWRNVRGTVRVNGDSVWMKVPHFDLPASTGRAEGKVVWGSDLPVRYAVRVWGDSVSLKDVAWVYPTLPTTGGGTMILDIRNERNLNQLDYALTAMDVRTTRSRLRGGMTFETGGPVLAVHDVKLTADPVDWDLLRALNGKPFPADWQGKLTGTVMAHGGPLNRFHVDAADMTFVDAHVPGAVSHFKGRGDLDILLPAFTAFRNFHVETDRLELRTLSAIYPAFPRIGGVMSGSAVLDSSWLDVRVSDAKLTHVDGPAEPTHATGGGRITYGTKYMAYDLDLVVAPLSLTTLARSYRKMPLRGTFTGPLQVKGMAPDLVVTADLTGPAGHFVYSGHVDADSVGGYAARGSGSFDALDAAAVVGLASPASRLAGVFDVDITGDSLATLAGPLALRLRGSDVGGVRIASANARIRFDHGLLHVDSLAVDGTPGRLTASGTLGLTRSAGNDSLIVAARVDSLGGLRRYLVSAAPAGAIERADTLRGSLAFRGLARGWLDSLDVRGALTGADLAVRADKVRTVRGGVSILSVRGHTTGAVDLRADSIVAAGVRIDAASLAAQLLDRGRARFAAGAAGPDGSALRAAGEYHAVGDTTAIALDTLVLGIKASRWSLRRPLHLATSPVGLQVDTLVLADATGARIVGFANVPQSGPARAHIRADSLPLGDVGMLAQLRTALDGRLSLDLDVGGTRLAPTMRLSARGNALKVGSFTTEAVTIAGGYERERARLEANLLRGGRPVLDAMVDYPVAMTLFSATKTGDSLRGRVHADSVDLALVEALSAKLRNATGRLALDLAISGRPANPHIGGSIMVRGGGFDVPDAGLRLASIEGKISVDAARDSLSIDRLTWVTPANRGTGSFGGSVVFRDPANPRLDLRLDARALRAVDRRNLARLDLSTGESGLTLAGPMSNASLSGAVKVDRGTIFIPELINKKLVELTLDDFAQFFDTTDVRTRSLMPRAPGKLVEHLRLDGVSVNLGDDVWLRSKEANIKLGGSLNVTRARTDRGGARADASDPFATDSARYVLALAGSLSADRGTYTLDVFPVTREFQVQSGRITFFGTPDFNPEIDVTAGYRVKQQSRADISVQARIFGFFYPQPALSLSTTDPTISPSDLVSYLVAGRPSRELTDPGSKAAADLLLPTISAMGSRALRDQLGSFVDLFQIQSGGYEQTTSTANASGSAIRDVISTTRLGAEKQISDKLFLSLSTGLCFTGSSTASDSRSGLQNFGDAIEGKLEYRFPMSGPDRFSLRAGREPAASALRCDRNNDVRGFARTPDQWGLSLFRSWVF